jgi:hypothetical protein
MRKTHMHLNKNDPAGMMISSFTHFVADTHTNSSVTAPRNFNYEGMKIHFSEQHTNSLISTCSDHMKSLQEASFAGRDHD